MATCDMDSSQVANECQTSRRSRTSINDVVKASEKLDPKLLYDIPLIPVDCRFGIVKEQPENTDKLKPVCQKERRAGGCKVTVLFAIRRPGCGNCREHGRTLTEINNLERDVSFIGAMKHGSGVDDEALLDFYQQYYRFPLFKDEDWKIYNAMGGRKLSFFKALSLVPRLEARYKKKGIPNIPFGGDIWTQGGIMIFDREGNLRHTHYEKYGEELDIAEIRHAIREARKPIDAGSIADTNISGTFTNVSEAFSSASSAYSSSSDESQRIEAVEPPMEKNAASPLPRNDEVEVTAKSTRDTPRKSKSGNLDRAATASATGSNIPRRTRSTKSGKVQSPQQQSSNQARADMIRAKMANHRAERRAAAAAH